MKIKHRKLKYCKSLNKRRIRTKKKDMHKHNARRDIHAIIKKYYYF